MEGKRGSECLLKSVSNIDFNPVEELQNKYKDVYLIRSDERNTKLKLHEFADNVSHYAGFLPDFVLYLANES